MFLRHPSNIERLQSPREIEFQKSHSTFDFDEVLQDKKTDLPWGRRVKMAQGIADLSFIRAQGAVHRDIKSLNVLVRGREVNIADFGSIRDRDASMFSNALTQGEFYAFRVVMFELTGGRFPGEVSLRQPSWALWLQESYCWSRWSSSRKPQDSSSLA